MAGEEPARAPREKRWGLRTLAYLALAAACLMTRSLMHSSGNTDFVLLPFLGIVVGLVGATVCSVRGLRAWNGFTPSQ
jgi:hypothetical protein